MSGSISQSHCGTPGSAQRPRQAPPPPGGRRQQTARTLRRLSLRPARFWAAAGAKGTVRPVTDMPEGAARCCTFCTDTFDRAGISDPPFPQGDFSYHISFRSYKFLSCFSFPFLQWGRLASSRTLEAARCSAAGFHKSGRQKGRGLPCLASVHENT